MRQRKAKKGKGKQRKAKESKERQRKAKKGKEWKHVRLKNDEESEIFSDHVDNDQKYKKTSVSGPYLKNVNFMS